MLSFTPHKRERVSFFLRHIVSYDPRRLLFLDLDCVAPESHEFVFRTFIAEWGTCALDELSIVVQSVPHKAMYISSKYFFHTQVEMSPNTH